MVASQHVPRKRKRQKSQRTFSAHEISAARYLRQVSELLGAATDTGYNAIVIGKAQSALLHIAEMFDPSSSSPLRARIGYRSSGAPPDRLRRSEKQLRDARIGFAVTDRLIQNLKAAAPGTRQRDAERLPEVIEEVAKEFKVSRGVVEAAARVPRTPAAGQTSRKKPSRKS